MNWREVPIPKFMQALPRDRRGLPIPAIVMLDTDGTPHFTVNDSQKRAKVLREDRCGICGNPLFRGRWFVGGPLSAFSPRGCYIDPPMHGECVAYALQVCPYLAAPRYTGRLDDIKIDPAKVPGLIMLVDETMLPDRPETFVAIMAVGQAVWARGATTYVKPKAPYRQVQYWRHGSRLADSEGAPVKARAEAHTDF